MIAGESDFATIKQIGIMGKLHQVCIRNCLFAFNISLNSDWFKFGGPFWSISAKAHALQKNQHGDFTGLSCSLLVN